MYGASQEISSKGSKRQAADLPEGEGIEIVQTFEPIPLYVLSIANAVGAGRKRQAMRELLKAYKTIKQMERQGKSREEINTVLKEKFADKKPNPSA